MDVHFYIFDVYRYQLLGRSPAAEQDGDDGDTSPPPQKKARRMMRPVAPSDGLAVPHLAARLAGQHQFIDNRRIILDLPNE